MVGFIRRLVRLFMLGGIGYGAWKAYQARRDGDNWQAQPWPATATATATATVPKRPEPPAAAPAATPPRAARPTTRPAGKAPTGRAEEPPGERLWVTASDGVCPTSHPVKAKLSSKIFHTPASPHYGRTKADRCYPDAVSAAADGLRPPAS